MQLRQLRQFRRNRNRINRGLYLGSRFPSSLTLGRLSKITADHYVNLIAPVSFGDYSVLAGSGSQVWSHGFVHHATGRGRASTPFSGPTLAKLRRASLADQDAVIAPSFEGWTS